MSMRLTTMPDGHYDHVSCVKRLMVGCAPSAGLYHAEAHAETVAAIVRRAVVDHHITAFDTAPWYGCGRSELHLGAAIEALSTTAEVKIATKVGRVTLPREGLMENLDDRAKQLGLDTEILRRRCGAALQRDTCYLVGSDTNSMVCVEGYTACAVGESWKASQERLGPTASRRVVWVRLHDADTPEFIEESCDAEHGGLYAIGGLFPGVVTSIGLNDAAAAEAIVRNGEGAHPINSPVKTVMIAGCWNLLDFSALSLLQHCESTGVEVHLAGVFASGFLWGGTHYRYQAVDLERQRDIMKKRSSWEALAVSFYTTLPAVALQFAMMPVCVTYVAIGCATVEELDACVALVDTFLDLEKWRQLLGEAVRLSLIPDVVADAIGVPR